MSEIQIATIVEGHGECEAVPILIRRIALNIAPDFVPQVLRPFRVPASRLRKEGELERTVIQAARKLGGTGGIIILVDCDWDGSCPAIDGPALLNRAKAVRNDMPISVILAKKEFEAWFLAAAQSLAGFHGLPDTLDSPDNPEEIRDAKGWINNNWIKAGGRYSETIDQAAYTAQFNLVDAARNADSFDKCYRDIRNMLELLYKGN